MRNPSLIPEPEEDDALHEFFDSVTEDEIMYHWRAIRSRGLSDDDAWDAIVTGIALDMGFGKDHPRRQIEH